MIRKIYCFSFLLFLTCKVFAQDISPQLPQMLPESPTAQGLMKVGLAEINKSTGAATANINLFTLKVGSYSLPISLNYYSQGNKVEELCSRVGFGWSLLAGGVVTRRIMGGADEYGTRPIAPVDLSIDNQQNWDFCENHYDRGNLLTGNDTQPDEYIFSFNGYSGKFVIGDDGTPVIISHQNLKITADPSALSAANVTITTPDGVKYFFGGASAYGRVQSTGYGGNGNVRTEFYLYKILLPSGGSIDFNYSRVYPESMTGFTETMNVNGTCTIYGVDAPTMASDNYSFQYTVNDACYLNNITTSEGVEAEFHYQPMPLPDISGDVRLTEVILSNQTPKIIKDYVLSYYECPGLVNSYQNGLAVNYTGRNGRFYLKKLTQTIPDGPLADLSHTFEYYGDIENTPLGGVFSQDIFGFRNGKSNSHLIPHPDAYNFNAGFNNSISWANRDPDWNASMLGMLKKISYPTKGIETFFYEANTIPVVEPNPPIPQTLTWTVTGGDYPRDVYQYLIVNHDQDVHINLTNYFNSPSCTPGAGKFLLLDVKDMTTNTPVYTNILMYEGTPSYDISFAAHAGDTYSFHSYLFPAAQTCIHDIITVFYDAALPGTHQVNKEIGGVRVKQIQQVDQFNANLNKYYTYASLDHPDVSSGIGSLYNYYTTIHRDWFYDNCVECYHYIISSNGIYNLQRTDNSHIYYTSVIESSDPNFTNGGTETTFYPPTRTDYYVNVRGSELPNPPSGLVPTFDGLAASVKVFDANHNPQSITENNYEIINLNKYVRSFYIRKAFKISCPPDIWVELTPAIWMPQYDIRESVYAAGWLRLHNTKVTNFDNLGHSFETNTTYNYGTSDNVLPASIATTDSKQLPLTTEKKYPTDFPTDPVATAMVTANIITPLLEESTLRAGTELQKTKAIYADNGTAGGGLQPNKVQQKQMATGVLEDRILFSAYDNKGNLTEVSKAGDGKISYIRDYLGSLVMAEVKNAAKENIAYTSFEADGKGNFTFSGAATVDATSITGKKVYDLSGGAVSFPATLDLNKSYIVSYWSKSGPKAVSGSSATTTGRSVGPWTYYEHKITVMPTGGNISGSGVIDELRLYPTDAMMTTFTYEPLVGETSVCDINNRITYYEYDDFGRLSIVRNQDKNIVKKICYNYAGQQENCFSFITTTPDWQPTGQTRCKVCSIDPNFLAGFKEEQQEDMNVQSPTHTALRWVDIPGSVAECLPATDWHLTGNIRCQKINNVNTGWHEAEMKDVNPCSPDYNRTYWVQTNYNTTSCPVGGGGGNND